MTHLDEGDGARRSELARQHRDLRLCGAELPTKRLDTDQHAPFRYRSWMLREVAAQERAGFVGATLAHQHAGAPDRRWRARRAADAAAEQEQQPREHRAPMLPLRRERPLSMSTESTSVPIERVAVVGAGQMGAGIAQVAARAGLRVTLSDQAESQAVQAKSKLEARLRKQQAEGKVAADVVDE